MTPIELILSKLPNAKRNGQGWQSLCPAHEDQNPSLSISEGDDGRALLKCHAGCATENVVAAMGLPMLALMPASTSTQPSENRQKPQFRRRGGQETNGKTYPTRDDAIRALGKSIGGMPVAGWPYHDARGNELFWIVRFETPKGKSYRPVSASGSAWRIGGMVERRPLYRLQELADKSRVYVCEGEKAADAARSLGLTATTSAHGANSPDKTDWTPLAGREVVILPDSDGPGRQYGQKVVAILKRLNPAPVIKVIELPDMPEHGDMVEFIEIRGGNPGAIVAEVEALVHKAPPVESLPPKPQIETFRPFPLDALPEPIRSFVGKAAKAIGCDPSFAAMPMLATLASAIGNTRRIQLKRGWTEPAILWTAVVGESGTLKTPAFKLVMRPLREIQGIALKNHSQAVVDHEREMREYERDLVEWKKKKAGGDPPQKPDAPQATRLIVSDTTVEALAPILLANPRGVIMARDELAGWIGSFDRYAQGKGADSAHWLSMHNGETLIVDRKTGVPRTIYVPRAAVSVTGGIQPVILGRVLGVEHRESGLAARLLLAWPPRKPKRWSEADIAPEMEAEFALLCDRLLQLRPNSSGDDEFEPVVVPLLPEAKAVWVRFYNQHAEEHLELAGDLSAAWSKLEGYAARLAMVIHFIRWAANDPTLENPDAIDAQSIAAGVTLSRWFGNEARRVYGMLSESDEEGDLRRLKEWIERQGGPVTVRVVQQGNRRYATAEEAEEALEKLVKAHAGCWEPIPTTAKGGRPSYAFKLYAASTVNGTTTKPAESAGFVDVGGADDDDWGEV